MVATARFGRDLPAFLLPLTTVEMGRGRATVVHRVEERGGVTTARQVPVEFDDVLDNGWRFGSTRPRRG